MAESSDSHLKIRLSDLAKLSWPWRITIGYLTLMLLLPVAAILLTASTEGPTDFWKLATSPIALSAYNVTFVTAALATVINSVFGILVAWVLVRYDFPLKRIVDAAIDLPFALPSSVAGLTLATVYSENGWIGSLLAPFGIQISFTRLGVAVAMIYISMPFIIRTVQPVLQEMEREVEEAAWSLGASQWRTFRQVIVPSLLPAMLTGVALGFARAVGEFGSVVIVASNIPSQDLTAAVLVFQLVEQFDIAGATVIGTVLLGISLLLLLAINLFQAWGRRYEL